MIGREYEGESRGRSRKGYSALIHVLYAKRQPVDSLVSFPVQTPPVSSPGQMSCGVGMNKGPALLFTIAAQWNLS